MSKRTKFLDGKLTGSFPGLTAVLLSFSMAFAACNSPVSTGSDSGSGDPRDKAASAGTSGLALNSVAGAEVGYWNPDFEGIGGEAWFIMMQTPWSRTLSDKANQAAFGWPADECAVVTGAIDAFVAAFEAYMVNETEENLVAKEKAKKVAVKAVRDFANARVLNNNLVSKEVRRGLGISL